MRSDEYNLFQLVFSATLVGEAVTYHV